MTQRLLIAAIFLAALAIGAVLFLWQPGHSELPIAKAPQGGDFTLNSVDGPVSLSDFKGKVVVLYFGYTLCPDICPTSLALFSAAMQKLTTEQQRQIQPIFISVDPKRDSLEHLRNYSQYFHSGFIGLTGSPEAIKKAADLYGASYRKVDNNSAAGYLVDHSAYLYLIDRSGRLSESLAHGTSPDRIRAALLSLLNP